MESILLRDILQDVEQNGSRGKLMQRNRQELLRGYLEQADTVKNREASFEGLKGSPTAPTKNPQPNLVWSSDTVCNIYTHILMFSMLENFYII